jgi:hypothetical protein
MNKIVCGFKILGSRMMPISNSMTKTTSCYWLRKYVCVEGSTQQICDCVREIVDTFVFFSKFRVSNLDTNGNLLCLCPGCVHAMANKRPFLGETFSFVSLKSQCVLAKIRPHMHMSYVRRNT